MASTTVWILLLCLFLSSCRGVPIVYPPTACKVNGHWTEIYSVGVPTWKMYCDVCRDDYCLSRGYL